MKLAAAYSRLLSKAARTREEIDQMTLAAVEAEIERLSRLVRAWQVVAHSRRTSERWSRTSEYQNLRAMSISPEKLRLLSDQELRDLKQVTHPEDVRRMINAESLRRAVDKDRL
jgi:hypothetical protein